MTDRNSIFWAGIRAELPLLVGVFPFGLIYGALALSSGLSPLEAQMMSSIVFAGSSQFIAAQLFHEAQLLGHPGLMGFVQDSPIGQDDRRVQHAVKSPWDCPSRPISRPLPRLAPRTRRTESGRLLARC